MGAKKEGKKGKKGRGRRAKKAVQGRLLSVEEMTPRSFKPIDAQTVNAEMRNPRSNRPYRELAFCLATEGYPIFQIAHLVNVSPYTIERWRTADRWTSYWIGQGIGKKRILSQKGKEHYEKLKERRKHTREYVFSKTPEDRKKARFGNRDLDGKADNRDSPGRRHEADERDDTQTKKKKGTHPKAVVSGPDGVKPVESESIRPDPLTGRGKGRRGKPTDKQLQDEAQLRRDLDLPDD